MREYDEATQQALQNLVTAGAFKFMIHSRKGDWKHKTVEVLLAELKREVEELEEAIITGLPREHIISELGDIANYAAMILDKELK